MAALLVAAWVAGACSDESVVNPPAAAVAPDAARVAMGTAQGDRAALVALYEATDGPNWRHNTNWLTDKPLGEWYGVTTNADGRVVRLDLTRNGLTGTIPPELGELDQLGTLWLLRNDLTGPIPAELGNLTSVWQMSLAANDLSGAVPPELSGLADLEFLYLNRNELSGTIPPSFQQLSKLEEFDFQDNSGLCLPDALVAWYEALDEGTGPVCPDRKVLQLLYETAGGDGWINSTGWLGDGPLGEWYGVDVDSAGLVSTLDLAANGLSGGLPGTMGDLAGLKALRVGDNALTGRLPTLLRRTPLQELRYANTSLCAPAEAWFQEWLAALPQHEGTGVRCAPATDREIVTALYHATDGANWEHSANWLTDAPLGQWHGVQVSPDGRVVSLDLRSNGLEGEIPPDLGGLDETGTLILFNNSLAGPIPPELGALANAQLVVLARNQLSGPIPPELGGLASAEELYLHSNLLTSVPPELGELGELWMLNLADNQLTSVPAELGGLASLRALNLNHNQLTSVPAELGGLANLEYLGLWSNELTSVPPELGALGNLVELDLDDNWLTSIPAELGRLEQLQVLWLGLNELTSVPAELGALGNLVVLNLRANQLTDLPFESGGYASLSSLSLASNEFTSFPWEFGELESLEVLDLDGNRLGGIPPGAGGFELLRILDLSSNELTSFPWTLGELGSLYALELDGNRLVEIPPGPEGTVAARWSASPRASQLLSSLSTAGEASDGWRWDADEGFRSRKLDQLSAPQEMIAVADANRRLDSQARTGNFPSLQVLDLSSNELSGPLPTGLFEFTGIRSLSLADNGDLAGPLPLGLTVLEGLDDLHTTGTNLCAPADPEFVDWLEGVTRQRVARCGGEAGATAYLTQAVQSRAFPVPLVADEPALLRVFVTAERAGGATMPPVRATFYRDGVVTHQVEIPGASDAIPAAINESSLSNSANAEIPGGVIQPGLEVVIEPDPAGTLNPRLGVPRRIPAVGRMAVDVRAMPVFEVTLVPFIWLESPDSSIIATVDAMAADPAGHELFERTHLLLPISEIRATAHEAVVTATNNGFELLSEVEMIRVAEGGRGHYLAVMAPPTTPRGLGGVANDIGSWSSFSVLVSEIIAHEFGHNRALFHAPCGGAGGPDRYYPYGDGQIGAWGYDFEAGTLVPPGRKDFMSYCGPTWTSDYQFTNAVRYRLETETGSVLIAAAEGARAAADSTLLVWGGLDGDGTPHLRPAFFVNAPAEPPKADGPWSLTGTDAEGAALFSLSFAMAEYTDTDDERAGFTFAVPATWTGELARISLQGPGGSASLDRDTDLPTTILRDPATRRIRGILEGPSAQASAAAARAQGARDLQVIFSRGIPTPR